MVHILYFRVFDGEVSGIKPVFLPSVLDVILAMCHISPFTLPHGPVSSLWLRPVRSLRLCIWSLGPNHPFPRRALDPLGLCPHVEWETFVALVPGVVATLCCPVPSLKLHVWLSAFYYILLRKSLPAAPLSPFKYRTKPLWHISLFTLAARKLCWVCPVRAAIPSQSRTSVRRNHVITVVSAHPAQLHLILRVCLP